MDLRDARFVRTVGFMQNPVEKRIHYRRYEDRRVAMMLSVYEILFDYPPGAERNQRILSALAANYHVERAAILSVTKADGHLSGIVTVSVGPKAGDEPPERMEGEGFSRLADLHDAAEGALSFESVRKPEAFSEIAWRSLWEQCLPAAARALLSMEIGAGPRTFIWLQQISSTREWSSRDRELIEEVCALWARAIRRGA